MISSGAIHLAVNPPRSPREGWGKIRVACGVTAPGTCSAADSRAVTCPDCLNAAVLLDSGEIVRDQALREMRRSLTFKLVAYCLVIVVGLAVLAWIWSAP